MNKSSKSKRKEQYIKNRKLLIELSKAARALVKEGQFDSVNEALTEIYMAGDPGITGFNTFGQWKNDGYTIVKGSKAYLVWGQPRQVAQTVEGSDEPEEFKYWPLAYLFANTQVFRPAPQAETPDTLQVPEPVEVYEDSFF